MAIPHEQQMDVTPNCSGSDRWTYRAALVDWVPVAFSGPAARAPRRWARPELRSAASRVEPAEELANPRFLERQITAEHQEVRIVQRAMVSGTKGRREVFRARAVSKSR